MSSDDNEFAAAIDEAELKDDTMKVVRIDGVPILFAKVAGQVFVVDNRCPHMGCMLNGGTLDGYVVVCPCHDWRFDLRTGKYQDDEDITLTKYEWKAQDGKIWVKPET